MRLFTAPVKDPDVECAFIDGRYVNVYQHSTGATSDVKYAMGQVRGGNTSKIHLAVDSDGLPVQFMIAGAKAHDSKVPPT